MKYLLLLCALLVSNSLFAVDLPYSQTWQEVASKYLSPEELKIATYILTDMAWEDNLRSGPDAAAYSREINGDSTGLDNLDSTIAAAAKSDLSSFRIVTTLLQYSSYQRPLAGLVRSAMLTGTLILGPGQFKNSIYGIARVAISRSLKKSKVDLQVLSRNLAAAVLSDPDNIALAESITAVLVSVSAHEPYLRDYFLLMSIHPDPKVRMSGLLGLSPFAKSDGFVRATLLEESSMCPEARFAEPNMKRIEKVLSEVAVYPVWTNMYREIYERWISNPFQNRIQDRGDYNYERMANGAAAQALLQLAGPSSRELTLTYDGIKKSTIEKIYFSNSLPRLDGLISGNGTGFRVAKSLHFYGNEDHESDRTLSIRRITLESSPENACSGVG